MRYFIHLAYNGTRFSGWQIQPNATTLQGVVTQVLQQLLQEETSVVGAGRTDSGVHSANYFAHFETDKEIATTDLCYKLNRMLPPDIVIFDINPVDNTMHARFSATSRTYTYTITQEKNPFALETEYYFPLNLNIENMNNACKLLIGTQDFTSFSKLHTDVNNNICTIKYPSIILFKILFAHRKPLCEFMGINDKNMIAVIVFFEILIQCFVTRVIEIMCG